MLITMLPDVYTCSAPSDPKFHLSCSKPASKHSIYYSRSAPKQAFSCSENCSGCHTGQLTGCLRPNSNATTLMYGSGPLRESTDRMTKEGVTSAGLLLDFKCVCAMSTDIIVSNVTEISNAMHSPEDDWIHEHADDLSSSDKTSPSMNAYEDI